MALKRIILALLALLAALIAGCGRTPFGVWDSGAITSEARTPGSFSAIAIEGFGDVTIVAGDRAGVVVATDANLQDAIRTEVRDDTLYLEFDRTYSTRRLTQLTYTVTVNSLEAISLSGAATVQATDLSGDRLVIRNDGAGAITLAGAVREQEVTLSGTGRYDAAGLHSARATITIDGLGEALVNASEQLDVTINGAGNVSYLGNPEVIRRINGLGEVRQR
jgi:hypothetical protein